MSSWIQSSFGNKISSVILFIIVLLAFLFFIAALIHLLIRFLLKQRSSNSINYPEISTSTVFQRQLQHLFHLHDSGLDQATIDALPVFLYKDILGFSNEPFDCAVCLCEFLKEDKLRLLPLCSHAFHIDCIDTWLLSNSTCPLCRGVILSSGFSFENPVFYFDDSSKEHEDVCSRNGNFDSSAVITDKRVFSVRLGKFKNVSSTNVENGEDEIGETSSNTNCNLDVRRCYSMGSFQYVVDNSDLQVALCSSSRIDMTNVKGGEGRVGNFTSDGDNNDNGKKINSRAKGESFSVSKIWLWSKKGTNYSTNSVNVGLP